VNWSFAPLAVFAYLLGSVPAAYIAARLAKGIDLRRYGSGNVGSSNVFRTTSRWLAIPVFAFDTGKGYLVVWLAAIAGLEPLFQIIVGVIAVAGHNWPVFLGFKGGRGIATSLGVVLAVSPWLGLIVLAIAYGPAPFKQMATGVLAAVVSLPLFSTYLSGPLGISNSAQATWGFVILLSLVIVRRLAQPRASISRNLNLVEVLVNRLIFDRDIRDRKAWLSRAA
jgi:glycerol-3-phosphate acyltransferase PlsY